MGEIIYDCRWSDNLDEKFINDFIATENAVFGGDYTEELFNQKYVNNIYGKPSYQPGDTCVTEVCRGKGIFTEMTKRSVAMLSDDDIIYNFPNQNSYPGYMKMGWKLVGEYGMVLFTGARGYLKEHPVKMDYEYANWWLQGKQGLYSFRSGKDYFLMRPIRKCFYRIVACVPKEVAERYESAKFAVPFYRSTRKTFYNKNIGMPLHVVTKQDIDYTPLWKIDAI